MNKINPPYVLGIDVGTSSVKIGIFDLKGKPLIYESAEYPLYTPKTGWAEQDPLDWWKAIIKSINNAIKKGNVKPEDIIGIGADATSCTVLLVDENGDPIRPAIMWMDVRASEEAKEIALTHDPALKYNGYGNVSAEWLPCKALWLKKNEKENYLKAYRIIEAIDWLMYKLTGNWTTSLNTATIRGYYDNKNGGWPIDFYTEIGLEDIFNKFNSNIVSLGKNIGGLSLKASRELGLKVGTPIAEGGADALVAMVGLNVVEPGRMAFITGSSHLHLGITDKEFHGSGMFGSYPDALISDLNVIEGGQISTGSIVNWFKNNFCSNLNDEGISIYDVLNREAAKISPGSEGLIVLDYWQGNRTPLTDSDIRGLIYGLSLKHNIFHIYRAIIEGISYGTEHILKTFKRYGFSTNALYISGGVAKSKLWMQIHSDVSNVPIYVPEVSETTCLGSAILGAVAANAYPDIKIASKNMVSFIDKVEPNSEIHSQYEFYIEKYIEAYPMFKDWMHSITQRVMK